MIDTTRTIAVAAADLIFAARIRAAAEAAGMRAILARNEAGLRQAAAGAHLVLIDLDARWLDAPQVIGALRAAPGTGQTPIVAFVSHVRTDAIEAARLAGATRVLARSALVRQLHDLLAGSLD